MNDINLKRGEERILVVNPGSTSTKIGVFTGGKSDFQEVVRHPSADLGAFHTLWEQYDYRLQLCLTAFRKRVPQCGAVAAMGGLFRPLTGGTYRVNSRMLQDARAGARGEHASNLGCALADAIAAEYGCPAYVVDPVSVDEFEPIARYSGTSLIERGSLSHALNIHAAARRVAADLKREPGQTSVIVVHMGGGISVAPVRGGRIVDVNDAASDGPFSPERTGGLPMQQFIGLCFSGMYTEADLRAIVMGRGGLVSYLDTNSAVGVEERIAAGDRKAREVYEAMAYQIAKEIGAMATVLDGRVDAVVLTGGLAESEMLTGWITNRVKFIAPVYRYPREMELEALAHGALRVLRGIETEKEY